MAQVRSRASASSARQSRVATELPDYQPPAHPLNLSAQQAIRDLPRSHKLDALKSHLKAANNHLTESAAEVNDHFQERVAQNEKRNARRAGAATSSQVSANEDTEREMDDMRTATDAMTTKLERSVRMVIDAGEEVKVVEEALRELDANVTAGRGVLAPTQSTLGASQFRQNHGLDVDGEENEDENRGQGAVEALKQKIGQHRTAYNASTMTDRYASHNDYVGFKKIVHDAHYPGEEAPPMPHASTWFGDGGGNSFSQHQSSGGGLRGGATQPDEDDDLVMASERISVKCPITLTEMKEPVSSTKCPHNFERQAFLEMVNSSEMRVGAEGRRNAGTKAMRCPVAGCDVVLTASDVRTDAIMVRKIKRVQAALHAQNEPDYYDDDEDDVGASRSRSKRGGGAGSGRHDEEITSSPAPTQSSAVRMKAERLSRAPSARQRSMIPNSQAAESGEAEDDEDED